MVPVMSQTPYHTFYEAFKQDWIMSPQIALTQIWAFQLGILLKHERNDLIFHFKLSLNSKNKEGNEFLTYPFQVPCSMYLLVQSLHKPVRKYFWKCSDVTMLNLNRLLSISQ